MKNLGKREQIVALAIAGILSIGLLHLLVFGPRASQYVQAYEEMQEKERRVANIQLPPNPRALEELEQTNKELQAFYEDALSTLSLSKSDAFDVVLKDDIQAPESVPETERPRWIYNEFVARQMEQYNRQLDLVMEELTELRQYDSRLSDNRAENTTMSFMQDFGWRIPTNLPVGIEGGVLGDIMVDIIETRGILENIPQETQPGLWQRQRNFYEQLLAQLGINKNLYRNLARGGLPSMGEFVPLINMLAHYQLVNEALGEDAVLAGQEMTRETLFRLLEIHPPLKPLVKKTAGDADDSGSLERLDINEMYFLYEQLRFLNTLLEIAVENDVAEIAGVVFEDYSYLVKSPGIYPPPREGVEPRPTPEPDLPPYVLPPEETGAVLADDVPGLDEIEGSPPGADDIGYSVPIRVQFRASNLNAWQFIWEVLRQNLMAEFDILRTQAVSQQGGAGTPDIWFEVRFDGVPYLFALDEKKEAPAVTPTPPPGAQPQGPSPVVAP